VERISKKNEDILREKYKNGAQQRTKKLSDSYVKGRMRKAGVYIPTDVHAKKNAIELYKIQILIHRLKNKVKKHEK
jgi:hypothetical protein